MARGLDRVFDLVEHRLVAVDRGLAARDFDVVVKIDVAIRLPGHLLGTDGGRRILVVDPRLFCGGLGERERRQQDRRDGRGQDAK